MRQTPGNRKSPGEKIVKDIKRATRKHYSSEEKIRIVLGGLRGEDSIAELCRREGISQGIYYKWSKDFMEAGKRRLSGDTARAVTTDEVLSAVTTAQIASALHTTAGEQLQRPSASIWGR
jgi:transposase